MDEVRLYNRALSAAEIQQLYRISMPVSGVANGFNTVTVTCTNNTTAKTVTFISTNAATSSWNCEQKGLVINPGNLVTITLSGNAL